MTVMSMGENDIRYLNARYLKDFRARYRVKITAVRIIVIIRTAERGNRFGTRDKSNEEDTRRTNDAAPQLRRNVQ